MSLNDEEFDGIVRGVTEAILTHVQAKQSAVAERLEALQTRIDTLEARPELKWAGPYRNGESYSAGCFVSKAGGLWLCERPTSAVPGHGDSGWRLVVKEGRA